MTKIKEMIDDLKEEIDGAKCYAEKALESKISNSSRYSKYKSMAEQELEHASIIHEFLVEDINSLKAVYPNPPQYMMEEWEKSHKYYIEKVAWIKMMLSM
jgi:hypothetical protein